MNSTGSRSYSMETRKAQADERRQAVVRAVRTLLADGAFHEASVDDVARIAGVSRATVYGHFGSRTGLVDAVCETLGASGERAALRAALELPDPVDALRASLEASTAFWAAEEAMLGQLTALAGIDPAAADWRARQRADRRAHCAELVTRLDGAGALEDAPQALDLLLVATSFEAFAELREHAGASVESASRTLARMATAILSRGIAPDSEPRGTAEPHLSERAPS
jgi:AcrR family transcriptional regulator